MAHTVGLAHSGNSATPEILPHPKIDANPSARLMTQPKIATPAVKRVYKDAKMVENPKPELKFQQFQQVPSPIKRERKKNPRVLNEFQEVLVDPSDYLEYIVEPISTGKVVADYFDSMFEKQQNTVVKNPPKREQRTEKEVQKHLVTLKSAHSELPFMMFVDEDTTILEEA